MKIPFLDLTRQHNIIRADLDQSMREVMEEQRFVGGERVARFEQEFALTHQADHCIGTGNATDALLIVLKALNIGAGDEVIVPAHGWLSAAEMVFQAGARAVFADVDPDTYCIDAADAAQKINQKTRAIIPIHLYGQMADMRALAALAEKHNLHLIEDAAQAHFASQNGHMAGSMGTAGVFSFYPSKLLGAMGDGGCITTNDQALADRCRALANHGGIDKNTHEMPGLNSRLDTLQAAVLSVKMKHVDDWITARNHIAGFYSEALAGLEGITTPQIGLGNSHNFHLYVIKAERRDALKQHLEEAGVQTDIHYPVATPFTPAFQSGDHDASHFPVSEQLQHQLLSLPVYATLTGEEVRYITDQIKLFYGI